MGLSNEISRLFPAVKMQKHVKSLHHGSERFSIDVLSDAIHIDCESRCAQEFAMHKLLAALQSGTLREAAGAAAPLYEIRPLWVHAPYTCTLPSGIRIHTPDLFLTKHEIDEVNTDVLYSIIWHMYDLGFNTLIFAPQQEHERHDTAHFINWHVLHKALDFMRSLGINLALHLSPPPCHHKREANDWNLFFAQVGALADCFDFLFWQENELWVDGFEPKLQEPTQFEKAQEEIAFVEKICPCPLFYHFPSIEKRAVKEQAEWLIALNTKIQRRTVLSFSASLGSPFLEDTALHPLFNELSGIPAQGKGKFIPFLGLRQYGTKEGGMISDFPFSFVEKVFSQEMSHKLYGLGCEVHTLPEVESFAEGALWAIGQRMWRNAHSLGLFGYWLCRYHKDVKEILNEEFLDLFHKVAKAKAQVDREEKELSGHMIHDKEKMQAMTKKIEEAVIALCFFCDKLFSLKDMVAFLETKESTSFKKLSFSLKGVQSTLKKELEACCNRFQIKIPSELQSLQVIEL